MKRGDIVIAGERGSFAGKPRPWLVLQADDFLDEPFSVTVATLSSTAVAAGALFRVAIMPTPANGLEEASFVLADKIITLRATSIVRIAGSIDRLSMIQVENAVRVWLDL